MNESKICILGKYPDLQIVTENTEFWDIWVTEAMHFFKACILPELFGKWYSRADTVTITDQVDEMSSSSTADQVPNTYCYCKRPEGQKMIACENPCCTIEWLHVNCLKITTILKAVLPRLQEVARV